MKIVLRRVLLFLFGSASLCVGGYLFFLCLEHPGILMLGGGVAATFVGLGGYLLWDDFIKPRVSHRLDGSHLGRSGVGKKSRPSPRLYDRLALRCSTGRNFDGIWVGALESKPDAILQRVEDALRVIKMHEPVRYRRLHRDLERVWVLLLPGPRGCFNHALLACQLDSRFVLAQTSNPEIIAAVIVHEATHARLMGRGIGYDEGIRARVERVCIRRELAFAAKLPNGEQVLEQAERRLPRCDDVSFWTNAAFSERQLKGIIDVARRRGTPEWYLQIALALRSLFVAVRCLVRHR